MWRVRQTGTAFRQIHRNVLVPLARNSRDLQRVKVPSNYPSKRSFVSFRHHVAIGTKWGICSLTCSLRISWFSTCRLLRATVIPVAYTASFYPTVNDTAYCPADKLSRDTLIYVIQPNVFLYQTVYIMLYLYIPESSVISLWYSFARIQVMSS